MQNSRWLVRWLGMAGMAGVLFSGCVRERSPITGQRQAYAFSWDQEQQIGKESDQEIVQHFGLYEDPAVQSYVQNVGRGVLLKSDLRDQDAPVEYRGTPFTFRVLNSPVVNAFALPGGYIYVTRGLLTHLNNEAQLAVVLGHEIAHVAARHSARQALKGQAGQVGLIAAAILGSQVLGSSDAAQQIIGLGSGAVQLLMTKYSRDAEREADRLGVEYASLRGYDAAEGAPFFRSISRLGEKEGVRLPSWQATHPDPGEREATVIGLARQFAHPLQARTRGEEEFLARLEGMAVGEDPREGFVENNRFYHPELRFQFPVPPAWKVQNERAAVLIIDPNREALLVFEMAPGRSARAAAQQLSQVPGLQVTQSGPTQVNGLNAYVVQGTGRTQQGEVALVDYFIEHGGRVYSFMAYTAAQRLPAYASLFRSTLGGSQPLTDPRLLNVQPARLTLVEARRSGAFQSFLPERLPRGLRSEDLAILNQVRLEETIPAGKKLKLPK